MENNSELIANENDVQSSKSKALKETIILIITIIIFVGIFLLTNVFFAIVMVSGSSMCDTVNDGDVLIVSRGLTPDYGDVIVFNSDNGKIIKRVVAKSGDTIFSDGTNVYLKKRGEIEFSVLEEPYAKTSTTAFTERVVDENSYFVMGDNRAISNDSRYVGFIAQDDVLGVVTQKVIDNRETYTKLFSWIFNL